MKRTPKPRTLNLTRETIRQLSRTDLTHAVGGEDLVQADSEAATCPRTHIATTVGCIGG